MGDFWKPTSDMYTSLFTRPKMDEQLLKKPPFKYLFDVLTETTKVTGFGRGLLNEEETNAKFYESRERKIAYLQKFIDLVKVMGKEQLQAKPAKIVAGLEPENTNGMLQAIYKLAVSGDSSDAYVAKVLNGDTEEKVVQKPKEKPKEKEREKEPTLKESERPSQKELVSNKNLAQENPRAIRPPSAPRRGPRQAGETQVPTQQKQVPSRQGSRQAEKEDEPQQPSQRQSREPQKQVPKDAQNYSKKVKQAMEQNQQVTPVGNQQVVKKVQMGNLRKRKNQSRTQDAGSIGAVGQINQKQLQSVKSLIQSICQNSTPLSKSIQFLNDDVQAMNQQLNYWRKQYNVSKNKMQNELKITEDALVPLYDKLAQIDEQIKDQKSKIQNVKSQIIKNQSTINALLYSVVKG